MLHLSTSVFGGKASKGSVLVPGSLSFYNAGGQYIMLTFDDGPHSQLTPKLLEILKAKKVRATFFVLGSKAMNHAELLQRMVADGHEIGNHGWNHGILSKMSRIQMSQQIRQTTATISAVVNRTVPLMRPPYGNTNIQINDAIKKEEQMQVVLWNLDSKDWETIDPAAVEKQIVDFAKPGDIILCHDIHSHTVDAMARVIDTLHSQGYEFLTVSEMLSFPDDSPHRRRLRGL